MIECATSRRAVLWFCLWGWFLSASTAQALDVASIQDSVQPWSELQYIEDGDPRTPLIAALDLSTVEALEWHQDLSSPPNFGLTRNPYWFRLPIENMGEARTFLLEIGYPLLDNVAVYWIEQGQPRQSWLTGDHQVFSSRPELHRFFVFPIEVAAHSQGTLLIRVQTSTSMQVPITLWQPDAFRQQEQLYTLLHGSYVGIMLVMLLYNLFLYLSVREKSYLYYVQYVACVLLFQLTLNGFSYQYLWPESIWWNDKNIAVSIAGALLFASLFANEFMQVKWHMPRFSRWIVIIAWANGALLLSSFWLPYHWSLMGILLLSFPTTLNALLAGVFMWLKRERAAAYYTLAWFGVIGGALILPLSRLGWLPRNDFTEHALQIGTAIEVILLSLAMAERIHGERKEKLQAQARALVLERRATDLLEKRVAERTEQLQQALDNLSEANTRLKEISEMDGLTQLFNRRYFEQHYDIEWRRSLRDQLPLALLLLDVDHFKQINDQYGHQVGDAALQLIAETVSQHVHRPSDFVARYGGEEFIVVLSNTTVDGAYKVACTLNQRIQALHLAFQKQTICFTVSIGVAGVIPEHSQNRAQLLKAVDEALYDAKQRGRNRCVIRPFFAANMDIVSNEC